MNDDNPLAFGDPEIMASMITSAVTRRILTQADLSNATTQYDSLDICDHGQAREKVGSQVELANAPYRNPEN